MSAQRVIGIDVGGTKILAGVVDARRRRSCATARRRLRSSSQEAFLAALETAVVDAAATTTSARSASASRRGIDQREGTSVFSVHVPLAGVDLAGRDGASGSGLPVAIDNDANAAAVAEWTIGAGRGTQTWSC